MSQPTFRVKHYAHGKYKFLVRWKVLGKWRRRYFATETEAIAFAKQQNARAQHGNGVASTQHDGAAEEMEFTSPWSVEGPQPDRPGFARDFSKLLSPDYLGPRIERYLGDSWCMHLPFAYDLTREFAPRVFVELGVKRGESYFAFCQSAAENKIDVRCYGVDSWRGTLQTGGLDPGLQAEVEAYNRRYSSFSELKAMPFADALKDFPDGSIDLLHLDGRYTYTDVKTDFESWLPKLSPNGIILFHDVMLRDNGFGVWKLWEEITREHDSFLFEFGCGLGVWKKEPVTTGDPSFVRRLFSANEAERREINEFYANAAAALALWRRVQKPSHTGALGLPPTTSPHAKSLAGQRLVSSAPLVADARQTAALHAQYVDLQGALEQARATSRQLSSELHQLKEEVSQGGTKLSQVTLNLEAAESRNREYQAQLELAASRLASLDAEVNSLRGDLEQARAEASGLSSQQQAERAQNEEAVREFEQQRITTQIELQETREALSASRDETARFLEALEIQRIQADGFAASNAKLQARLANLSRQLLGLGTEVRQANSHAPGIVSSITEDIGRIHHPSFLWRVARGLGLLRRAPQGTPRSASERRKIAHELRTGLRDIRKALVSESRAPEELAFEISRLFELHRRARTVADSLRLSRVLRFARPGEGGAQRLPRAAGSSGRKRSAAVLFDAAWYLGQNPDVAAADTDPFEHYLKWGAGEGRNPNPLFQTAWYLARNPDVAGAKLNPLEHYCEWGVRDRRDPNPLFSTNWYLAQNPDVTAAHLNPLAHYLEHGAGEGRDPHPLFEAHWYLAQNPEARGLNPLEHYLRCGCQDRRSPHPLFDATWYLAQHDDLARAKIDPLLHYLGAGGREGRDPHPLFDSSWYLEQNPDLGAEVNPLQHYVEFGGAEGRDPHPLFDSRWYLEQEPVIKGGSVNPLEHYVLHGAEGTRSPHPLFDSGHYLATYLSDTKEKQNPLVHYLTTGWRLGYQPNRQFDPALYLHVHPDIAEAGIEPFTHYILSGKREGRISTADEISFKAHKPDFEIPRESALPLEDTVTDVKAIAFYLPQFHRIPENDAWWGEGFTEWSNVRRGHPNFEGHYQPHVPSVLGYYDLSEQGVLERQTQLARQAGIHGFCYYYYWFGGQVLLDLPVRRIMETGKPDFPFCVCWANENWTRRWDGKESEILIAQRYSPDDDLAFIQKIEPVLRSRNYIRVEGKPMLLVYRPSLLPDAKATLDRWRSYAHKVGLGDLHLVMVYSFSEHRPAEFYGFDAAVQFPPHLKATPVTPRIPGRSRDFTGFIYDYTEVRTYALQQFASAPSQARLYPGVMPSWDNTARQLTRSTIWVNSSPEAYCEWLAEASRLVRTKRSQSDHLVFINAWNEWAEGCHLEPDERHGYAWLNATSLALRQPSLAPAIPVQLGSHPEPPVEASILVQPLTGPVKLVVSVLFYHREDILMAFVTQLLPQLRVAAEADHLSWELFLSFNYRPSSGVLRDLRQLITTLLPHSSSSVHIIENSFNLGFGAGHNAIFQKTDSDVFITLNSDLHIEDEHWLAKFVDRFRSSDAAILGLAENASRLREDGCGVPVGEAGGSFDFVDGSVLAIRSDLAIQFGLFSPSFDYFYFEDVDLNLRYRQMGLRIETLDLPCLHERSSSTRLLPKFAVESVLNQNRARFFERWGGYLTTRRLTNRLALRFREADRQLQCASLPAIFGLLSEHPTAVLDLWGVHEQLIPLFQHPRIRLIPWWQEAQREDYLRWYELSLDATTTSPLAVRIAEQMLVDPAFQEARRHLESLVGLDAFEHEQSKRAVIYLARPQTLFEGRQPEADSLLAAQEPLRQRGFAVQYYSEYGVMEVPSVPQGERRNWKYVAQSNGLDFLGDLARAEVLVTSDGWAAELGQLLSKKTIVWLGATSVATGIWNADSAGAFFDSALSCLGCHERFGQPGRNVCLRGDQACVTPGLAPSFGESVGRFLDNEGTIDPAPKISLARQIVPRPKRSEQEKLEAWPQTSAGSVLVLTPINPALDPAVLRRARELAERAIGGMRGCRIVYDDTGEAPPRGSTFPHRLAAMTPLRQAMIDRHLRDEKWVFWVDADLVDYPANLVEELISRAEGGIAAPIVLMEGDVSEPAYQAGFGPGRFYDIAGFIEDGRWARFTQPYFDQPGPVYRLDSVGCCYLVNADLYRWGAKHELDYASKAFIAENRDWPENAIQQNQSGPANSFTDHYSVCEFARKVAVPVQAFADLIACHQRA
jgi:lipopolysaccharide biosynthesis protein/GT2 family glycosyltransferase